MNIKDVARLSGVSISTVSRVINRSAYVNPDIRRSVEKVLEETGYRPNALARGLLSHRTHTIGVMLPRIDLSTFAAMIDGIAQVLDDQGYGVMLANTRDDLAEELHYLDLFNEKRIDGLLFFGTGENASYADAIAKLRAPVVLVGQSGAYLGCPSVRLDNFNAAKAMVNYLIGLGHRRIGCLAVPDHDVGIGIERKRGYLAALAENGLDFDPALLRVGSFEYASGEEGVKALMAAPGGAPTAIYTITDRLAVAAAGWLLRSGRRVPEDVSVACIDDPELLSFCYPAITAMSFDYRQAGMRAARMLIDNIEGKADGERPEKGAAPPVEVVMPHTLRVRESTGVPEAKR